MTSGSAADGDPGDTARYIGQMAVELRRLAAAADLGFLAYLLRMVEDEAGAEAAKRDPVDAAGS